MGVGSGIGLSEIKYREFAGKEMHSLTLAEISNHNHGSTETTILSEVTESPPRDDQLGIRLTLHRGEETSAIAIFKQIPRGAASAGANKPFSLLQPYISLHFCVRL